MIRRICIAVVTAGLLSGLATAQTDEAVIRSVLEQQVAGWNDGSMDRYMEGYWQSDSLTFVSGGSVTRGYDSTLARYRRSYATREKMGRLEFNELRIRMISTEAAMATGIWKLYRSADAPWGRFTLLLNRMPTGWRIVYDHTSSAQP